MTLEKYEYTIHTSFGKIRVRDIEDCLDVVKDLMKTESEIKIIKEKV